MLILFNPNHKLHKFLKKHPQIPKYFQFSCKYQLFFVTLPPEYLTLPNSTEQTYLFESNSPVVLN